MLAFAAIVFLIALCTHWCDSEWRRGRRLAAAVLASLAVGFNLTVGALVALEVYR